MSLAARAVVRDGKIQLLDDVVFPEGAQLVVSIVSDEEDERAFWYAAGLTAMQAIWDNAADDVYAQLLAPEERDAFRRPARGEPEGDR
jgi:hypothetical protein